MAEDGRFRLSVDDRAASQAAWRSFERLRGALQSDLPTGAIIEHVGATAVPGCLTKGDLDIVVRVSAADFTEARAALLAHFPVNDGSVATETFQAFADDAADPPLGVQLVVTGSEFDDFTRFRDRLRADPALVERYNALKRAFDGRDMDAYRAAKAAFIAETETAEAAPASRASGTGA